MAENKDSELPLAPAEEQEKAKEMDPPEASAAAPPVDAEPGAAEKTKEEEPKPQEEVQPEPEASAGAMTTTTTETGGGDEALPGPGLGQSEPKAEAEQTSEPMDVGETQAVEVQQEEVAMAEETAPAEEKAPAGSVEEEVEPEAMEVENKENIPSNGSTSGDSGRQESPLELCYCGNGRSVEEVELQCSQCLKWFHKACIKTVDVTNVLPYMSSYTFCCKNCSQNQVETFSRKLTTKSGFKEMCHCALANLHAKHKADTPPKALFSKETDIIPFIDAHWEQLTPMPRRATVTWHATVVKSMMKEDDLFVCKEKPDDPAESDVDYPFFGLLDQDLSKISPYSENRLSSSLRLDSSNKLGSSLNSTNGNAGLLTSNRVSRSAKRKGFDNNQGMVSSKRTRSEVPASQKLPPHGYPLEHPFNKDGYRYVLTEPDPHAPSHVFEEDQWIGKPIPAHLYRMALSRDVLLALHDRAPQLKISEDRLSVTGDRGYCMVRSTHGIHRGSWYFEVSIDQLPEGSATRLGWSQPLGNLQAPCGYDKFSYSWRSRKGTRFHESRGKHYSEPYGPGDTLGFFIQLPERTSKDQNIPPTYKDRALIKFKSHLYFEEKDQTSDAEKALQPTQGTKIIFFKNGVSQGVAYENIYEGAYHPAVSIYKQSSVTVNFGPKFQHPPPDLPSYRPISDLANLAAVEQTLSDILFLTEHEKDYELAASGVLIDI